jgi:hypothetical protein
VATAACELVAACYAVGYVIAAKPSGGWLSRIENWNFYTSLFILGVLLALFTPVADPKRVAVADQMSRLNSGKVKPEAFDFNYLRWEGGRYGRAALIELSSARSAKSIREQAGASLTSTTRYTSPTVPTVPANLASRLIVHPPGRAIPPSFLTTKWNDDLSASQQPLCITSSNFKCDVVFADLDGDGRDEIILLSTNNAIIYREGGSGTWRIAGTFDLPYQCQHVFRDALFAGKFQVVKPPPSLGDIEILGIRLHPTNALMLFRPEAPCPK